MDGGTAADWSGARRFDDVRAAARGDVAVGGGPPLAADVAAPDLAAPDFAAPDRVDGVEERGITFRGTFLQALNANAAGPDAHLQCDQRSGRDQLKALAGAGLFKSESIGCHFTFSSSLV